MTGGHFDAEKGVIRQEFECSGVMSEEVGEAACLWPEKANAYVVTNHLNLMTQGAAGFFRPGGRYVMEIREKAAWDAEQQAAHPATEREYPPVEGK